MKRLLQFLLPVCVFLSACSDNDSEFYPSIITEIVVAQADEQGLLTTIINDRGRAFQVSNEITGLKANERVRALIGYVVQTDGLVEVYSAQAVPTLSDVTDEEEPVRDPTGIESAWYGGGYLNFHFLPKTQGGRQGWAFMQDSTQTNDLGGTNYHLSLYHDQMEDAEAYSTHFYACVALDSIATRFSVADSIVFVVNTYEGLRTWYFGSLIR